MSLTLFSLRSKIHEQEVSADASATVTHAGAATTTGDIAQYPWPLGVPREKPPKNKKKRNPKPISENVKYESPKDYAQEIIFQVAHKIDKSLEVFGMDATLTSNQEELIIKTPLENEYRLFYNGYDLVFAPKKLDIKTPDELKKETGTVAEDEVFLSWEMPTDDDVGLFWGVTEKSILVKDELTSMVIGLEIMLETPPFVDLSTKAKLSKQEIESVKKNFRIIDSKDYRGSVNLIEHYRQKYGKPKTVSESKIDKPVHRPYNDWKKTFFFRDFDKFRNRLMDYKWNGHKAQEKNKFAICWNNQIRYNFTTTSTDYIEALVPCKDGKAWCTIHTVRKLPAGYDDYYFQELTEYLNQYKIPTKFENKSWDFPGFLRQVWDVHADEITYVGGIAYHKEGRWGIDFQVSASGRGLPDSGDNMALIVQYYFQVEPSTGLIKACVDPTPSSSPTDRQSTVADFIWNIYPSFDIDYFVAMLKKYTDST